MKQDIKKYYRFLKGLKGFLRTPAGIEKPETREAKFLTILKHAVFEYDHSPYRKLFDLMGISQDKISAMVSANGVESTLNFLAQEGIYFTYEEFKGIKKTVRKGRSFYLVPADFDNPLLAHHFNVQSGGTGRVGSRSMIDFDFLAREAIHRAAVEQIYNVSDAPVILWFPILPGNAGIMNIFRQAKIGHTPVRWFSQVNERNIQPPFKDRMAVRFVSSAGRLFGTTLPKPEYLDLDQAWKIAEYILELKKDHSQCSIWTYVSSAVRIAAAARARKWSLKGAHFFVVGEPISRAKRAEISETGAEVIPYYAMNEAGIAAYGCARPQEPDDMHILNDHLAIIDHNKKSPFSEENVAALLITSLLQEAPKILLNVETGDMGKISHRSCGCGWEKAGYTVHLSDVRSFEKTTSEGMTFLIHELISIAENILPRAFGGSCSDYQVIEESDGRGLTTLTFAASPGIGQIEEDMFLAVVQKELKKGENSKRLMAEIWKKAGVVKLKRMNPIPTRRGKVFSYHKIVNK